MLSPNFFSVSVTYQSILMEGVWSKKWDVVTRAWEGQSESESQSMSASLGVKVGVLLAQLCRTLGDLMDCSAPGSSVHGILWTRILQWVAMPSSRGYSRTRYWTHVSCIAGRFFTTEPPRKLTVKHFSFCGLLVHHQENEQFDLNDLWDLVWILMFLVF